MKQILKNIYIYANQIIFLNPVFGWKLTEVAVFRLFEILKHWNIFRIHFQSIPQFLAKVVISFYARSVNTISSKI